jgi:hypothetical protein
MVAHCSSCTYRVSTEERSDEGGTRQSKVTGRADQKLR